MPIAFPPLPRRAGLGVGFDLPWIARPDSLEPGRRAGAGFHLDATGGDTIAPPVASHLARHADDYCAVFGSWQPKNRNRLMLSDYRDAWEGFVRAVPDGMARGLHQTTLNLGALEPYERAEIIRFTNELARHCDLRWVNEDVGLWSLNGRPLPYPLPPWLTPDGLRATIDNTRRVQDTLEVPLLAEFPGFSEGTSFFIGHMDAYDFFAELATATDCAVTLDLGHLLSWRWTIGKRGEDLYGDLDRLPLGHCAELHLSGCATAGDAFFDYHHGILMTEQLELLKRLLPRCPELRLITYEDPAIDGHGAVLADAQPGFAELRAIARAWATGAEGGDA